jgi:poly(3-hydroxybutyrate) depolymerase
MRCIAQVRSTIRSHLTTDANDKSPISEIATQHVALIPISISNMLWSNFATRTFVGRINTDTRMNLRHLVLLTALCIPAFAVADPGQIESHTFKDSDGEHRYALFLPKGYSADKKWPVILFLHGAGERGSDGKRQTTVGIGPVLKKRAATFPFVVVMPQCEDTQARYLGGWLNQTKDATRALAILNEVETKYSIDEKHRVLTGWSMGGYGTWSVASNTAKNWSAVLPLAGGAPSEWATKLKDTPLWAFHGAKDAAIRPSQSRQMIAALRDAGAKPRYTEVTDGTHDITQIVYDNDAVIGWMLNPQTVEPTALVLKAEARYSGVATPNENDPFIPAMQLSNAVSVRLGNRMLESLAVSVPAMIPKDLLRGRIADIQDQTVVEGRNFAVRFGNISYSADIKAVQIKAYRKDRLNVQVGISNVRLNIGGSSINGRSHSATTGPMDIVIGHRAPVYISFDVTPYIAKNKMKLKLVASRFNIPNNNWYVTQPNGVRARGLGMTSKKVSDGLVNGVYSRKARIEQEVRGVIPDLVKELESKLSLEAADQLASGFWPLPVYKPRLRLFPQTVSVDEKGVSLVLGVMAAAVDAKSAPAKPLQLEATGLAAVDVNRSEDLQVAIAPKIIGQLSQLMIDADVARIHVLDIPENSFAAFADRAALAEAIPELSKWDDAELWPELIMSKPMKIADGKATGEFSFELPELQIALSGRRNPSDKLQPIATISIQLGQGAKTELVRPSRDTRAIQLDWVGNASTIVSAKFDKSYTPADKTIHADKLQVLAKKSWQAWTGLGPAAQSVVPDIAFGGSKLRLQDVTWSAPWLGVTFGPARVIITNSTDTPLVYETKGPDTGWGGPYTLSPGKTHDYKIAHALTYRRKTAKGVEQYTLAPGSHSEFRAPQSGGAPQLFRARDDLETGKIKPKVEKQELTAK